MTNRKIRNNESGRTMIEMIMYTSFLIVLGGALASYAHTVMQRYKIGRTAQQIIDLKKSILHFAAVDEDYCRVTVKNLDESYSLPLDMRTGNKSKAKHALGGEAEVGCVGADDICKGITSTNDKQNDSKYLFYITFKNLVRKGCIEILTQGQFYGDGSELDTLIVNNNKAWNYEYSVYDTGNLHTTTLKAAENETDIKSAPSIRLNIGQAIDACSEKNNNTITWIFS